MSILNLKYLVFFFIFIFFFMTDLKSSNPRIRLSYYLKEIEKEFDTLIEENNEC